MFKASSPSVRYDHVMVVSVDLLHVVSLVETSVLVLRVRTQLLKVRPFQLEHQGATKYNEKGQFIYLKWRNKSC